ncbi:MAG: hypothetical protein E7365_04660 [Clostridiales bacterium]|nr:hypothetical protein [Clostridiales bacterium]
MDKIYLVTLFGIASVFIIIAIKKYSANFAYVASICAGIIILFFVISEVIQVRDYILKWSNSGVINSQYASTLIKICVISFVGQWGIQLCRDAGETSIADKMEVAVKFIVIILCFPYIDMLFKLVTEI